MSSRGELGHQTDVCGEPTLVDDGSLGDEGLDLEELMTQ